MGHERLLDGGAPTGAGLAARLAADADALDQELAEIELLVGQARTEAARHEQKRAQAAERLGGPPAKGDAKALATGYEQLVTLTRRAVLMEAQVEVLEGKRKALARHRDALRSVAALVDAAGVAASAEVAPGPEADAAAEAGAAARAPATAVGLPPTLSREVLAAQEDLRREIARALHDGPAQSLTNITLQSQILARILARDPGKAAAELDLLVRMVQQTLDATKRFIFDVRPMVLDDLGLVPTLRRATRERGRTAQVPVELEILGQERRLPMELESALFRILDEALAGYLAQSPDRVTLRLDWTDNALDARVTADRAAPDAPAPGDDELSADAPAGDEVPEALARMIEDRRASRAAAVEAARVAALVTLPASVRREIVERAATIDATLEFRDEGSEMRIVVPLPEPDEPTAGG